jgi:hypothetical protein
VTPLTASVWEYIPKKSTDVSTSDIARPVEETMKQLQGWRWRFRDPHSGKHYRTKFPPTAQEAVYQGAERIEGSMVLIDVHEDFADTMPRVFRTELYG